MFILNTQPVELRQLLISCEANKISDKENDGIQVRNHIEPQYYNAYRILIKRKKS